MSEPQVRAMVVSDLPAVLGIEQRLFDNPWTHRAFADFLSRQQEAWVLVCQKRIEGYLVCSHGGGEADLLQIGVDPVCQRRGYGARLLNHLFGRLQALEVQTLFLEVRASNAPAIACYRTLGMETVGVRANYYPAPEGREDGVMMKRDLLAKEIA